MINGVKCRALLDTGAGSSYASSTLNLILRIFNSATGATAKTLTQAGHVAPNFWCLTIVLSRGRLVQQFCMTSASFEKAFRSQQRDANTKESKDTVLESDDFPLGRSPLLFDNNL